MGRGGPIKWPSSSPDLTPCDYFLLGCIKDKLSGDLLRTMVELKTNIHRPILTIDQETSKNVFKNMKTWLNVFVRDQGRQFERFMN